LFAASCAAIAYKMITCVLWGWGWEG
jgi:hypothetical protein